MRLLWTKRLFTSKINLELKRRILSCLIWTVALYAAETWTLMKAGVRWFEAFEMWIWRRMEKLVGWTKCQMKKC